jgi:hypothetical protein
LRPWQPRPNLDSDEEGEDKVYPHPEFKTDEVFSAAAAGRFMEVPMNEEVARQIREIIDRTEEGEPDPDYDPDDDGVEEPDAAQHKFTCGKCKANIRFRSEFLLWETKAPLDANFGGQLQGVCLPCSGLTPAAFKAKCKKGWSRFGAATRRRSARGIAFEKLKHEVLQLHPGLDFKLVRVVVTDRLVSLSICFAAAFLKDPLLKQASGEAYIVYKREIQKAALDSSYTSSGSWEQFEGGGDASCLTLLADNCLCAFMCRSQKCLYFGDNSQWIAKRSKYRFRCPSCYVEYQPTAWRPDWHEASRVIGLADPITREWSFFSASWGDGFTESWLRDQAVAYMQARLAPGDVNNFAGVSMYRLSQALQTIGVPSCFSKQPFDEQGAGWANISSVQWSWDHIATGFWGAKLSPTAAGAPMFNQWPLLIELVGNACKAGTLAAAAGRR